MQAAEKKTASAVIILPFDAGAAGKYSYLKESLRNMLTTRLAARDGIRILEDSLSPKESAEIKDAKKKAPSPGLFARLHADYIVTGVLSSRTDGLDLHLIFYPAAGAKNPMKFSMSAENEEKILPSLDRLALEIGDKVAGTTGQPKAETVVKEDTSKQQMSDTSSTMAAFRTPHPERLYKTGIYSRGGIVQGGVQISSQGVRKSSPISMKMVAMAVGDLDGDGVQEIVLAEDGELVTFHFQEGRFKQIAKMAISPRLKIHAINMADLAHTGKSTIYISATDGEDVASLVLAWDKVHGLQTLHKDVRWYIRPLEIPGEGVVLTGQEKGPGNNLQVFPGIYEITFRQGSDVPQRGKKLSLPKSVNLFDFALADLNGDRKIETIVVDRNEKLLVYDQAGTLLWMSEDNFGGSKNYIGPSWRDYVPNSERIFVPTRILVADMNNDNKKEILIARNQGNSYTKYFRNSRSYDGGYVSCLSWTGSVMTELWHTNTLDGLIADYSLQPGTGATITKGGPAVGMEAATLFVGQIPDSSLYDILMPTDKETDLFAYGIDFKSEKEKK